MKLLSVYLLLLVAATADALLVSSAATARLPPMRAQVRLNAAATADKALRVADDLATSRLVRVANHASAIASLAYFGLVSSTMQMPTMSMPMATLASVITRKVGPTTNAQFSQFFSTLVTPAPFVFLIWPFIAAVQVLTVFVSIVRPGRFGAPPPAGFVWGKGGSSFSPQNSLDALRSLGRGTPLSQAELASLSLANAAATIWLFVSSNSLPGALPLASFAILPLVPLFAGYPLRSSSPPSPLYKPAFQIFSSFTTIASCLALAVELQYGGRVAFLAGKQELCGCVFLGLVGALVSLQKRSLARRAVTSLALAGVVARRLEGGFSLALLGSPTFVGAGALLAWSLVKLIDFGFKGSGGGSEWSPNRFGF